MRQLYFFILAFHSLTFQAQSSYEAPKSYPPMLSQGVFLGDIPPLRDLPQAENAAQPLPKLFHKRNYFQGNPYNNPKPFPQEGDPLAKSVNADMNLLAPQIILDKTLEGLRLPDVTPPDPTGDIGKNHYVQMINAPSGALFQVWDKITGQVVLSAIKTSTIWSQVGSGSIGDPIVQYDHTAERWIMMEMQGFGGGLLLAVSQTSDPTGAWKAYEMQTLGFPDYPKLYVWHNAYIMTVNEIIDGNKCAGYAIDRSAILNGNSDFGIYRFEMPNFGGIQYQPATGADWEGSAAPPQNSPAYIFRVYDDGWNGGKDHLEIWEVNVDWQNPQASNISGPKNLDTAPFETKVCWGPGLFDCIEQPDPGAPRITALENIIMYRAPYRNFGTYESVVFNHIADVSGQIGDGGDAAVRWYELQKSPLGQWSIHQEGTYAPDFKTNRFTGTISQDRDGNMALGYTVCSDVTKPGLRLTARRASDPLGEMTVSEYPLATGGDSHYDERWGDYSSMAVDPEDERTFWFTGEYQPAGAAWGTKIAAFRVQRDTYDITPVVLVEPTSSLTLGSGENVRVSIFNGGLSPASNFNVKLWFEGNLVASEQVTQTLAPETSIVHSFTPTVDMQAIGKEYAFVVVVDWTPDTYARNDSLRVTVKKLTSNDAAIAGRIDLPNLVCGMTKTFGLILENTSGLPMTSVKINYRANGFQPFQSYDWTGNLAAGAKDTVPLTLVGIKNGINFLQCHTLLPNNTDDQFKLNDTILFKYIGNIDGNYLQVKSKSDFGVLKWELLSQSNSVLASGTVSDQNADAEICAEDNTCYKLRVKSNTFSWQGHFTLLDIFGNTLFEFNNANTAVQTFPFCTPSRKANDVGAFELISPKTGANLSASEPVSIQVRNFGTNPQYDLALTYRINGGAWANAILTDTLQPAQDAIFTFPGTVDLSTIGSAYLFEASATISTDMTTANDSIIRTIKNRYLRDLGIVSLETFGGCNVPSDAVLLVHLRNNGQNSVEQVVLKTTMDNNTAKLDTLLLDIPTDLDYDVILTPPTPFNAGLNVVQVEVVAVNDIPSDNNVANNVVMQNIPLDGNGVETILLFTADAHPEQTTWKLSKENGELIREGGPYTLEGEIDYQSFCLKKDSCYVLSLSDNASNGLESNLSLSEANGPSIYLDVPGNFGSAFNIPFCAGTSCNGFQANITTTPASGNAASDGKITVNLSGGIPPYIYSLEPGGLVQPTNEFSNLPPGQYMVRVSDANNCTATVLIILGTVATNTPATLRLVSARPNPTTALIWLEAQDQRAKDAFLYCDVFDQKGKMLQTIRLAKWDDTYRGNLSLETYPSGVYYAKIQGWEKQNALKIIKQ